MLFLCIKNQYTKWDKGFLEGNSYQGHYAGSYSDMINLICPERNVITTYGLEIRNSMVEDPENEEKY